MTIPTPEQQPAQAGPQLTQTGPVVVTPQAGTKLEQLHALYGQTKAEADEAAKRFGAVKDALKVELTTLAPDQPKVELHTPGIRPLALTYSTSRRFDSTRFKKDHPALADQYVKESGTWTLAEAKGGE